PAYHARSRTFAVTPSDALPRARARAIDFVIGVPDRASVDLGCPCLRHVSACDGGCMRTWLSSVFLFAGCSTSFEPKPCAVDSDCGNGLVCELRETKPVCVHAEDASLVIGSSVPLTGTNQALGTSMKLGLSLAFDEQNGKGGIRGRQLVLDIR